MIPGIRLKICGLTTRADAEYAAKVGADYLGFIFYPKSPRALTLAAYQGLGLRLSSVKRVAVSVEPTLAELAGMNAAGFDAFQIHFQPDLPASTVAAWAETVGVARLWLAPKLPPGIDVPPSLLQLAGSFLLDTFDPEKFGGTGRTGDWGKFARHQAAHPGKTWILSGGLNADNIGGALRQSGARFVDVNSGVESAPGVKDHAKLQGFVERLRAHRV
jgi:phosphoribosylanthranilate isomerase